MELGFWEQHLRSIGESWDRERRANAEQIARLTAERNALVEQVEDLIRQLSKYEAGHHD